MKEDMLEVLIYLFDNYVVDGVVDSRVVDGCEVKGRTFEPNQEELVEELVGAGFPNEEVNKAFAWLQGLLDIGERNAATVSQPDDNQALRFYAPSEVECLGLAGQSLLARLEKVGVLDPYSREMVIDRVMAIDSVSVNLEHIQWVVLMVISNKPGFADIAEWAEVVVTDEIAPVIH